MRPEHLGFGDSHESVRPAQAVSKYRTHKLEQLMGRSNFRPNFQLEPPDD